MNLQPCASAHKLSTVDHRHSVPGTGTEPRFVVLNLDPQGALHDATVHVLRRDPVMRVLASLRTAAFSSLSSCPESAGTVSWIKRSRPGRRSSRLPHSDFGATTAKRANLKAPFCRALSCWLGEGGWLLTGPSDVSSLGVHSVNSSPRFGGSNPLQQGKDPRSLQAPRVFAGWEREDGYRSGWARSPVALGVCLRQTPVLDLGVLIV